jgi:hypothetical protein
MSMRKLKLVAVGVVLLGATSACGDLGVANENLPDRERAIANAKDVEALIAGSFGALYRGWQDRGNAGQLFPMAAGAFVTTSSTGYGWPTAREPRSQLDNQAATQTGTGAHGHRELWIDFHSAASSATEGLRVITERGLVLTEGTTDVTPRARAYAKFIQGTAWGQLANMYDQAYYFPETENIGTQAIEQGRKILTSYKDLLPHAINALEDAKKIAATSNFSFPSFSTSRLWFGTPNTLTRDQFVQLVNTMEARMLVLQARNPTERAAVDWNRVLALTAAGLTTDFEVVLSADYRVSTFYQRSQNNTVGCTTCYRMAPRLVGMADVSGAYQAWLKQPLNDRRRFDVVTPDRRITGATPKSNGTYLRYRADDNGFIEQGGLYLFSAYQWGRHAIKNNSTATANNVGTVPLATADENALLRAEALLRTGDRAGAAALINVTRTRQQRIGTTTYPGLPPVTASGVPQSADCVPRTDSGACGDLMTALRYERMIELLALDAVRAWLEARGFGTLLDDTWTMVPVPGGELELLSMPVYSVGGAGGLYTAKYAPATVQ